MYYVYVLKSLQHGKIYIGMTGDLRKRVEQHNSGDSTFTKKYKPFKLIYYEASESVHDTRAREKYLKSGIGRRYIQNRTKRDGIPLEKVKQVVLSDKQ